MKKASSIRPTPRPRRLFGMVVVGMAGVAALGGLAKVGALKVFAPTAAKYGLASLFSVGVACAAFYKLSEPKPFESATMRARFSLAKGECELERSR